MNESHCGLRVNDRIRIVRMPSGVDAPGYQFPEQTRRLYKKLIARRRSLRVHKVDRDGYPWIQCRFRLKNGLWEYHGLMIDDDSWVRVKKRSI